MRRVLVADDDLDLLCEITEAVAQWGYLVDRARNGAELMEAMAERRFDLVITDVSMPWMTGLQASHSARYAGLRTPILVITALRDEAIADRVRSLGRHARLLRKPFDLEGLASAIDDLIGGHANEAIAG
jgi:DNA-binding response OmpR family regulator